ncbi:histone acetyltransferase [Enteropsectra breve]|nr:histone acetyltransferase [Enteropsectra breve]
MDLLNTETTQKMHRDEEKKALFVERKQVLKVLSTFDSSIKYEELNPVKNIFQQMLPKMPKEYITRQVYDKRHFNLVLIEYDASGTEIIVGAVCFRPFYENNLIEIVFFAVNSAFHISGFGTFLFNCLKEICKMQFIKFLDVGEDYRKTNLAIRDLEIIDDYIYGSNEHTKRYEASTPLYMLTYADNSAIGFFKKQGFTSSPRSVVWIGIIKDYEGGTLMECKIHKQINYLKKCELIDKVRAKIFSKMKNINEYHIVYREEEKATVVDRLRVAEEDCFNERRTKQDVLRDFLYFLICSLQAHQSAWPFLEPVNPKEVPDYLSVIKKPMDLGTIFLKHKNLYYTDLQSFVSDVNLMIFNCFRYNNPDTQYYRCGENMKRYVYELLEKYENTIKRWGFS